MSLKEWERMLGIDHQHAGWGETELGADPGVSRSERGSPVCGPTATGGIRVDHAAVAAARLPNTRQGGARVAEELRGEDDGTKPGAGDAAHRPVCRTQRGEGIQPPPPQVREPFHAGRPGTAGEGR